MAWTWRVINADIPATVVGVVAIDRTIISISPPIIVIAMPVVGMTSVCDPFHTTGDREEKGRKESEGKQLFHKANGNAGWGLVLRFGV